jgi:hypothetical protein
MTRRVPSFYKELIDVFSDFTDTAVKARKMLDKKRIDCQLIVYF